MSHSLQFHLISESSLTGEQAFTLQVAVHHNDRGGIIIQIPDNDRHGFFLSQFTGPVPPVSGYQLIAALRVRSCNRRNQHTILSDTVRSFQHGFIILDFERMVLKRV